MTMNRCTQVTGDTYRANANESGAKQIMMLEDKLSSTEDALRVGIGKNTAEKVGGKMLNASRSVRPCPTST